MASKSGYDVFLSFRGSDTRPNFTSHLYDALCRKRIKTFRDDKLDGGKEISSTLLKIIEQSKIAVIIFSENYADSRWCLDELEKIMECSKVMGQTVLPIFYRVHPSDVENQTGDFGKAFRQVQEEFNDSDMVQSWRTALTEAANVSGWDSSNYSLEANLCEEVACHIKKLCPISFTASPGLVGVDSLAEQIISYLCIGEPDVRCVGLWGMGGIGKTTIAESIHAKISSLFDKHCIFRDVRAKSEKFDLLHLRRSFISLLLEGSAEDIQGLNQLPTHILDELHEKKIFVVLDDLDKPNQLEALGVSDCWFGPGSRIIMTSRDEQVLRNGGVDQIYEMKGLERTHASELLRMKAFPKMEPDESYTLLLKRMLDYCKGVPLALKVLGSQLCQKSPQEWRSLLEKLQQCGNPDIMAILKISYDTLEQMEKKMFLDVACFYKGYGTSWVKRTLYGCNCSSTSACYCHSNWVLIRLKEKCLITINDAKILGMHDLIEEMGKSIARKEGCRLWNSEEICDLLKTDKENEAVEGIVLEVDKMRNTKIQLHTQAFSRMTNLRILQFHPWQGKEQVEFILESKKSRHLRSLPDNLSLIHWPNYPFKSLPSTFSMENLVELHIGSSNIRQLWIGDKCPQNLKSLFLNECKQLMKLPNLSLATKLCSMVLRYCESLEEINSSIQCLHNLLVLDLRGCKKLNSLPSLMELKSLNVLAVSECSNLKMLPYLPKRIRKLILDMSGVEKWSSLIRCEDLHLVTMRECMNITRIPNNILLKFNEVNDDSGGGGDYFEDDDSRNYKLDLSGCRNLHGLPVIRGYVLEINLCRTRIEELPLLDGLVSLKKLNLSGCSKLVELPPLDGLTSLESFDLEGCSELARLPPLGGLSRLQVLKLGWNDALVEIPDDIVSLTWLSCMSLKECKQLRCLPKLPDQLTKLQVVGCPSLVTVVSTPNRQSFYGYHEFSYINCMNFDRDTRSCIMADAHSIAQQLAILTKSKFDYGGYKVSIAGSEIPGWVLSQSQGSSVEIDLSPNSLMGFQFFVVLDFHHGIYDWLDLRIEVKCFFKDAAGNDKKTDFFFGFRDIHATPQSDHVFLLYNSCYSRRGFIKGTFDFMASSVKAHRYINVKKCGVCLV